MILSRQERQRMINSFVQKIEENQFSEGDMESIHYLLSKKNKKVYWATLVHQPETDNYLFFMMEEDDLQYVYNSEVNRIVLRNNYHADTILLNEFNCDNDSLEISIRAPHKKVPHISLTKNKSDVDWDELSKAVLSMGGITAEGCWQDDEYFSIRVLTDNLEKSFVGIVDVLKEKLGANIDFASAIDKSSTIKFVYSTGADDPKIHAQVEKNNISVRIDEIFVDIERYIC